jgi:hypothetical protein
LLIKILLLTEYYKIYNNGSKQTNKYRWRSYDSDVTVSVPEHPLGKVPCVFKIEVDGEVLGSLQISKGALSWRPKNFQKATKITWTRFQELMEPQKIKN